MQKTISGLERFLAEFPGELKNANIGVLCHAPSVTADYKHIIEVFGRGKFGRLAAIFGPQHGVFGQTQDNMIEWQTFIHPKLKIPVNSLYGMHRKPTPEMLAGLDALVVDIQDVGTRVYTYVWTLKNCMAACAEQNIPVYVLDRPNPVANQPVDGAVLKKNFFTFVGLAEIPLCHGLTVGELARFMQQKYLPTCDLRVIPMTNYHHKMSYAETGLPWVVPSPNMPTERTAAVYPGAVLIEALNLSEARGTTTPFELFGAPYVDAEALKTYLDALDIPGCKFRIHNYIPTFHKFAKQDCEGLFVHVTDPKAFYAVRTFAHIFAGIIATAKTPAALKFLPPPYEYEYHLTPFDILAGDDGLRTVLQQKTPLSAEFGRWDKELAEFQLEADKIRLYE